LDLVRAIHHGLKTEFPDIPVLAYYYGQGMDAVYQQPELWRDNTHLNARGSDQFSLRLAADWAEVVTRIRR
jgi:hypothetical protein